MIVDLVAEADRLLSQGRTREAIVLIERAATSGNRDALFQLAAWKLAGGLVARDVAFARRLFRHAAADGHVGAAHIEIALKANGSGAPPDWMGAVADLAALAEHDAAASNQKALLQRMNLQADGRPAKEIVTRAIAAAPRIWHVPALFTPEECMHVANVAADLLAPATVVDPRTGRNVANTVRTSDGAVIGPARETLVVQALNRRIAAASRTDVRQGEALAVLRYAPGQQFRSHLDAIAGARNQRVKTVLVYLNDSFSGGATYFDHIARRIVPRTGDAIIFDNVREDGLIDPAAQHAGEPVRQGTKWLATRWIRARPFDVWTGPEAA